MLQHHYSFKRKHIRKQYLTDLNEFFSRLVSLTDDRADPKQTLGNLSLLLGCQSLIHYQMRYKTDSSQQTNVNNKASKFS